MKPRSALKGISVNEDLSWNLPLPLVPLLDNNHSCTGTDVAWQPEPRHQLTSLEASAARVRPRGPTFHLSFPRANPLKKFLKPLPAEPSPPLLIISCRLLISTAFSSSASPLDADFLGHIFAKHNAHSDLQACLHLLPVEVLLPLLVSTEEILKWKIWFITISHQNGTYFRDGWVGSKKGCISAASVLNDSVEPKI